MNFDTPFVMLTWKEVESATSLSRSTIYSMINPSNNNYDATFPKPIKIGARAVRWRSDEIANWMLTRTRRYSE